MPDASEKPDAPFLLRSADRDWALGPGEHVIGRDASCDIVLDDTQVSRRHAIVRVADGRATLEDPGSSNGTMVNGVRVSGPITLDDGDRVLIGPFQLGFAAAGGSRGQRRTRPMPQRRRSRPTAPAAPDLVPASGVTDSTSVYEMFASAADRALREGELDAAASAVTNLSLSVRSALLRGANVPESTLRALERQAVSLFELTGGGHWLDQLLQTFESGHQKLTADSVRRVEALAEEAGLSDAQLERLRALAGS